jgi:hypothetical protein
LLRRRCGSAYNGEMKTTGTPLSRGLTRRGWATLLAATPLVVAQVATAPQNPAPLAAPSGNAGEDVRKVSERLTQTEVPMSVEPAFTFHAF